ncbi:hypothetical protein BGZ83_008216 [Gryganskiella cystojenkinii]|nr:hypothetical protein BGZ83_008216 [Gryganskiella cystojenkinii]
MINPRQTHPLDLPEFASELALYLTNKSLFACTLVSRSLHNNFLPFLWRHIRLSSSDTDTHDLTAPREPSGRQTLRSLSPNTHWIESLHVNNLVGQGDNRVLQLDMPCLQHLSVVFSEYDSFRDKAKGRQLVTDLVRRQGHTLSSLTLVNLYPKPGPWYTDIAKVFTSVWDILEGSCCSRIQGQSNEQSLKTLTLRNIGIQLDHLDPKFYQLLISLETLNLDCITFVSSSTQRPFNAYELVNQHSPDWKQSPHRHSLQGARIQRLSIGSMKLLTLEYKFLLDCQQIRSLKWVDTYLSLRPPFAQHLRQGLWPFLESLEISMNGLRDKDMAEIIETVGPLRVLNMDNTAFGNLSAKALLESGNGKHCGKLETLSLDRCGHLRGWAVQRFLCELPKLRKIRARGLSDEDVEKDPRPWVCKVLREFQMGLLLRRNRQSSSSSSSSSLVQEESEKSSSTVFWDRLSDLTKLTTLGLINANSVQQEAYPDWMDHEDIQSFTLQKCSLKHGLDRLKLKSLQNLRFDAETFQEMTIKDAQWMVEHWERLRVVDVGRANVDKEVRAQLQAFFKEHGIQSI